MTPLCSRDCIRPAAVLATDVRPNDPLAYGPVCRTHLRQAIARGLKRSATQPAGHRVPVMILPLDEEIPQ